ncbi:MAG: protein kinase [Prevotella sp.]|nr:protein kinase [Prevotella sp.]
MDESSQFTHGQVCLDGMELVTSQGATCDGYRVKLYGKLHFLKRLKPQFSGDIRYREALRKEFETGYRLEHPNLVRYINLEDDGILMEYVDGETLTQRLERQPEYFHNCKHTDKFIHQLLDVMSYLHSHQVLHLDLKPDNILLTCIGDDLKLIDLGCCLTDTFVDTPGRTPAFAAPEQLPSHEKVSPQLPSHHRASPQLPSHEKVSPQLPSHQKASPQLPSHHRGGAGVGYDVRTDIYAIGKILAMLSQNHRYRRVANRCMATNPNERYQTVEEIQRDLRKHRTALLSLSIGLSLAVIVGFVFLFRGCSSEEALQTTDNVSTVDAAVPVTPVASANPVTPVDTLSAPAVSPTPAESGMRPAEQADNSAKMKKEMAKMMNQAYNATIASFCDSVFPSPFVGARWGEVTNDFHCRVNQIGDKLVKKYPNIPESEIRQDIENQFQSFVAYVFGRMRENGQQ